MKMELFNFGDIVLLKFPFTDGNSFKKRPALVINDYNDDDVIVSRITSKIYNSPQDIFIDQWEACGLQLPSVIRVHKIATLEKQLVETVIGKISEEIKQKVKVLIADLPERKI
jgi:mRNA interferase MazF